MADNTTSEERSVAQTNVGASDGVEMRTNTRLRQKYYVDKNSVLSSIQRSPFKDWTVASNIIPARQVKVESKPVTLRCTKNKLEGDIQVDVVRDGQRIKTIKITCPCGRHTELNCEYTT